MSKSPRRKSARCSVRRQAACDALTTRRPGSQTTSDTATDNDTEGYIAELIQTIPYAKAVDLRTKYNSSFGATLSFNHCDITFYVALFQRDHFWRVIKLRTMRGPKAI
jgi:Protein of unknown function (DUF2968)